VVEGVLAGAAAYPYSVQCPAPALFHAQATLMLNLAAQPNKPSSDAVAASQSLTKTYARIITAQSRRWTRRRS